MRRNIKRALSVILVIAMCVAIYPSVATAQTYSGSCGESAVWDFDDVTGTLTISGTGEMDDYKYTQSSDTSVFKDYRETLKNVVIGEGITYIGDYTFYNFSNIENVSFPSTLMSIGISSFYGCSKITKIMLPESVTTIGQTAFRGTNLKSFCSEEEGKVLISDNITNIGGGCFGESTYITSVHIGKNIVSSYGSFDITEVITFNNLSEITVSPENLDLTVIDNVLYKKDLSSLVLYPKGKTDTDYAIPDGTTTLFSCFQGNSHIKNVIIPDSVTKINKRAFSDCTNLETVRLSESITTIPNGCFEKCKKLNNVVLPAKITSIESSAFQQCHSLNNISLNNGLKSLGLYAFAWCGQLKTITLPATLTSLSKGTFMECRQLENINIPVNISTIPTDCFALASIDNASGLSIDFEGGVTTIENSAFYNARFSDPLILPESVMELKSLTNAIVDRVFILNKDCIISNGAFLNCNATIVGYKNSTAEEFANNNSIEFVELCSNNESHNFKASSKSEPTCTEKGYTTYRCSICGFEYNDDYVIELGHITVIDDAVEPTCTENGLTEGQHCSICDEVLVPQATVDALGHTYVKSVYPSTCTKEGYTEYICEACGDMYTADYTDILEHSFDNNAEYCLNGCMEKNPSYIPPVMENTDVTILDNEQETTAPADEITEIEETTQIITQDAPQETVYQDITELQQNLTEIEKIQIEEAVTEEEQEEPEKYSGKSKTEYEAFRIVSGIKSVKIAWTNDEDLLGYEVYASNSIDGDFKKIDDVKTKESHYTVINGLNSNSVYYFRLVGYLDYNGEIIKMEESRVKGVFVK